MNNVLLIEHDGENIINNIRILLEMDLKLFVATTNTPKWLLKLIPEENIILTDTFNSVTLPVEIETFTSTHGIKLDAVGTFGEDNVTQVADLADALGLVGVPPHAARRSSNNKLLMRRFCKEAGIKTPNYSVVSRLDVNELRAAIKDVPPPCVVKPAAFGSRSCGTVKIMPDSDLNQVIEEIKLTTTTSIKESFKNYHGTLIVEEYMPGRVISIDGIIQNGSIYFFGSVEYAMSLEPWFTQESYKIPADLTPQQLLKSEELVKKIIKALNFDNCAFHCEQKISDNEPMLLEIAARLPGGRIPACYKRANGIDPIALLWNVLLGKKITVPKPIYKNHVIEKPVYPLKNGRLVKLEGLEEAEKTKGVWFFKLNDEVGENAVTYPQLPQAIYFYGLEADTAQELKDKMSELESKVHMTII
ncbi:MAG: ATP-grasp domain-containing protein [Candidatus Levybacteria bacterium]|nr:ATP-grasp domain-containing protein [Candidatus Levybacteria bacterium]